MSTVLCIECDAAVPLGASPLLGEIAQCPDCGLELEVTALAPLTVAVAPPIEEDWGE